MAQIPGHPQGCDCGGCSPFPGGPTGNGIAPAELGPYGPRETPTFDDALGVVLPVTRREGWVASIIGLAYARDAVNSPGPVPLATPLHDVYIAAVELNTAGGVDLTAPRAVLVNRQIRHFTIWSDGERNAVPPYIGGGTQPWGFVISAASVGGALGRLQYWWRWLPRDGRNTGL